MIRIIIVYHRFYVTMVRIMVNEYRVDGHLDGHAVQMCSSMGSRWWGHCETNSRPSDVALSVIPATLLTSSLSPPLTSHTSHLIADCAAWRSVCGALVTVMWWGNTQTSNHTGPMSVGNASVAIARTCLPCVRICDFPFKKKVSMLQGLKPLPVPSFEGGAELECESAATTLSDLIFKFVEKSISSSKSQVLVLYKSQRDGDWESCWWQKLFVKARNQRPPQRRIIKIRKILWMSLFQRLVHKKLTFCSSWFLHVLEGYSSHNLLLEYESSDQAGTSDSEEGWKFATKYFITAWPA